MSNYKNISLEKGMYGAGGTKETVAFEKAPQNFYRGIGDGYSLCKSDCSPIWIGPFPEKIVRERLREHPPSTGRDCVLSFLDGREIPLYGAYGITICAVWEDAEIPPYGK